MEFLAAYKEIASEYITPASKISSEISLKSEEFV